MDRIGLQRSYVLIIQTIYALICLLMARHDNKLIARNIRPNHKRNGAVHVACWIVGCVLWFIVDRALWLVVLMPPIGRLVFDVSLNLMRKLPIGYVSPEVTAGLPIASTVDKWEYRVFGDGIKPKILYLAIIITINLFIFFN